MESEIGQEKDSAQTMGHIIFQPNINKLPDNKKSLLVPCITALNNSILIKEIIKCLEKIVSTINRSHDNQKSKVLTNIKEAAQNFINILSPIKPKYINPIKAKDTTGEKITNAKERDKFRVFIHDGKLYTLNHDCGLTLTPFNTKEYRDSLTLDMALLVVSLSGEFYVASSNMNKQGVITSPFSENYSIFHHTTFLNDAEVFFSGVIRVDNGKICHVTNKSGHYQSNVSQFMLGLYYLYCHHLCTNNATVHLYKGGGRTFSSLTLKSLSMRGLLEQFSFKNKTVQRKIKNNSSFMQNEELNISELINLYKVSLANSGSDRNIFHIFKELDDIMNKESESDESKLNMFVNKILQIHRHILRSGISGFFSAQSGSKLAIANQAFALKYLGFDLTMSLWKGDEITIISHDTQHTGARSVLKK